MRKRCGGVFGLALVLAAGCAPRAGGGAQGELPALLPTLQASTFGGDSVVFVLQVTNTTAGEIPLEYTSGQTFDFVVTQGDRGVWRWSEGQAFTTALRTESVAPGETRTHRAVWVPAPGLKGDFSVVGVLTAPNQRVRQTTAFRLP